MAAHLTSLERNDVFLIVDNLDSALNVYRRRGVGAPQTALDIYVQSMISSLRRDILNNSLRIGTKESAPQIPAALSWH